ncbi:MAG: sigma-54-dependent transcriptional regulator [Desulfatibacillaceae bacterium]
METAILIVDDEKDLLRLLRRSLAPDLGCRVDTAESGEAALHRLGENAYDLVLVDIRMHGMDGLELLELIKRDDPDQTVVMMTGHGTIDMAVAAMKSGAHDFVTKPFEHDALVIRLEKALERSRLLRENARLHRECSGRTAFGDMVGKSPAMHRVFETIRTVAQADLTVLVTGESGTGKELAARAVHSLSPRAAGPFIAINCPTVPENILESELFGYKKGAFTHATGNRAGLFQEAQGGTIFLDEIGDITPATQTKLLRVLQEKEIKPLGDTRTVRVDVRIVASTNQDLREKMRRGEFREDFFYRLNVLPVEMPPLRKRREDIPLLAAHLVARHCREMGKEEKRLSPELVQALAARHWEGNVRELENVVVQGILFSRGSEITPADVGLPKAGAATSAVLEDVAEKTYREAKEQVLTSFNNSYIGRLLEKTGGNVSQAARLCGLERQNLQQIMRRYGVDADRFRE